MNAELIADFQMQYPGGATVRGMCRRPIQAGSVTVLFGPSGCGKTTILRCLAGLETPQSGQIRFADEAWFDAAEKISLPPQSRGVGYLSQDYALFPHVSVQSNIAFGLHRLSHADRRKTVADAIARFGLAGLESRMPSQLSGGQQQRVALARAVVRRPRLLLLDEPLSALDSPTRDSLRRDLRRWLTDAGAPVFLVTHDRAEAISIADHLIVLDNGQVLQEGTVQAVFSRPANLAVARVAGVETVLAGRVIGVEDGLATVEVCGVQAVALAPGMSIGDVYVCIRAEDVVLQTGAAKTSARNQLPGRVIELSRELPMVRVRVDCTPSGSFTSSTPSAQRLEISALITGISCTELNLHPGSQVTATLKAPSIHLIPRM